ncbi:1-(5-phosphoribosyl)-5-[(5-phosphoribosylamino)methylideneamino]imidazole-4-carboxamide isomerase [Cryomorphaceae bacterium 1068]|nr:1-(5-phosphoribosyl)-5-[(5-phosphoribosylamino)methylideneamino]imidazole-4-carboxamide isomerase [Cryomorphaceae bacterium 1068]
MKIIPAIDLIDGKCVRLTKGDYSTKKEYSSDPLDMAMRFADAGLSYLHLVDLDGARTGAVVNHKTLEKIASKTPLEIDFGGGIKSDESIRIAFESGAKKVTVGSVAVKNRELVTEWLSIYGNQKLILGADVKGEKIAISGWTETGDEYIFDFVREYLEKGFKTVISTDVAKDGMLEGPSFELYKKLLGEIENLNLIASGGVRDMEDLEKLREMGMYGAIIGKAIYEGRIDLKDLSNLC